MSYPIDQSQWNTLNSQAMNDGSTQLRQSSANEILELASSIAEYSSFLSKGTEDKLKPVLRTGNADPQANNVKTPAREMPPLFCELRSRLHQIEACLNRIDEILNLVDL